MKIFLIVLLLSVVGCQKPEMITVVEKGGYQLLRLDDEDKGVSCYGVNGGLGFSCVKVD